MVKLRGAFDAAVDVVVARGIVHVDVDELRTERAAERRRQVARLQPEDDVRAGVEDLELLDVEGAGLEVAVGRIGVVAGAVVVAVRVGHVEQQRARARSRRRRCASRARSRRSRLTATTLSTLVPPVIGTSTLNEPLAPAVAEAIVVTEFASVFVADT